MTTRHIYFVAAVFLGACSTAVRLVRGVFDWERDA